MKRSVIGVAGALLLTTAVVFAADRPVRNVSAGKHPNLAAAQRLCQQAFDKLSLAQNANEFDMGGHAKKAKELLEEADKEIKEAALAANTH
jgi:hypothetical protein